MRLFALHANINQELNGREAGMISKDITRAKEGLWTFWDSTIKLREDDVVYYWTYVEYNDGHRTVGYAKDDQVYTVTSKDENF